jgi:hypothetical protein
MPANRNDITKKPIMTATSRKEKWTYYSKMGKAHVVWANSLEEAEIHATEQGWTLQSTNKESNDEDT